MRAYIGTAAIREINALSRGGTLAGEIGEHRTRCPWNIQPSGIEATGSKPSNTEMMGVLGSGTNRLVRTVCAIWFGAARW